MTPLTVVPGRARLGDRFALGATATPQRAVNAVAAHRAVDAVRRAPLSSGQTRSIGQRDFLGVGHAVWQSQGTELSYACSDALCVVLLERNS